MNEDRRDDAAAADGAPEDGFEVRLEPINVDAMCSACDGCKGAFSEFSAVYVRKRP